MIKKDIVEAVAEKTGLNRSLVKEISDKFLVILSQALKDGKRVELRGFGVFEVKKVKGKKGRNPKTGEEVFIPARNKVVFKVTKLYKKGEKAEKGGQKDELF
ncbi:MAG: integration host factor subunit beta [Candidatus Omnitrophica bacterium]|nr:integration host factor subunit beta [Candidatus Omnitrophota bacterium]